MRTLVLALLLTTTPVFAKNMYIPAAGFTPGANGTYWRTDVRIFNPSIFDDVVVTLHFLPQGMDGRNISGRAYRIGKRETLVLDNAVATLAPYLTSAVGAIRIDSDNGGGYDGFIATSRTYTTSADPMRPGTHGQFVPALAEDEARTSTAVPQIAVRPDARTNVGVMNPGSGNVTVQIRILGTDGGLVVRSASLDVPPHSMRQWSLAELFGGLYVADGTLAIDASAPVFTWGSVIDNDSGDPIFVRGADAELQ
jgi:hypothetical protein